VFINLTMLAHSRPRLTFQALQSLGNEPDLKIMVRCDDRNNQDMAAILGPWSQQNSLPGRIFYYGEQIGTGAARNEIIKNSETAYGRGDYLYLSDNDVFFYPAVFEKLVPIYEYIWTLGFRVLGGVNHPYHQPVSSLPVYGGGRFEIARVNEVQALALQSMLMKWEVWDEYGPFDSTPVGRVRMSEDVAFTNKIKAAGGKIGVVDPALVVNTGLTDSFGEKIPGWEMVMQQVPAKGVFAE
jgi:hypothetical protein